MERKLGELCNIHDILKQKRWKKIEGLENEVESGSNRNLETQRVADPWWSGKEKRLSRYIAGDTDPVLCRKWFEKCHTTVLKSCFWFHWPCFSSCCLLLSEGTTQQDFSSKCKGLQTCFPGTFTLKRLTAERFIIASRTVWTLFGRYRHCSVF